jgi:integrase
MPKRALNDRIVKALKPAPKGQRYDVSDSVLPGLAVRVTEAGTKTFVLVARFPGSPNPTRRALGEYGTLTLENARQKGRDWLALIRQGKDPKAEEARQRLSELRQRANTFALVAEDFIKEKLATERKGAEVERDIRRVFMPAWGKRPITDISAQDVRELIKATKDRGATYQAHNLLGYARRLFSWAIDQQVYGIEASPCDRLKPKAIIGEKRARTRILSDDEMRAFWRSTSRMPYPYGPLCRLLLLTGQRHNEVAKATRDEFSTDGVLWAIGAERFKSDAPHMVPLTDDARAVIASLPKFKTGGFLFSTTFGAKPTVISDKAKSRLDAQMLRTLRAIARKRGDDPARVALKPWIIHDLRRTLRTHLAALRIPDHVAEMVIGHGRKGLQRVYDQHRYISEMREALALWAGRLRSIVEPAPANVIAIKRAS